MRGKDGRLNFSVTDRGKVWMEGNAVEAPIEKIIWEEMVKVIRKLNQER